MAGSLTDIFAAMQNGMIALGNLKKQMLGSFTNISGRLTVLEAQSYKVTIFTRVLSVASGNQSITGIGFRPRLIQFQTGISGGAPWGSVGQSDTIVNSDVEFTVNTGTLMAFPDTSVAGRQRDDAAGANYQHFTVASFDLDGFTLTWTKVGAPTATAEIHATCFR